LIARKESPVIAKSRHDQILQDDDRYRVVWLPATEIKPSPENDEIYGQIQDDGQMDALVESIKKRGLEEPILLTADHYILSGHRRFYAVTTYMPSWFRHGGNLIPCRIRSDIRREGNPHYHQELAEYNPQRVKTAGSLLKEALLRTSDAQDLRAAVKEYDEASMFVDCEFMAVNGSKIVEPVTDKKQEFLQAAVKCISDLHGYWPLSVRQIHYRLLNDPPLTLTPKRSKFDVERYRYKNDDASYQALVRLLRSARYHGHVSMSCIDDPTRPQKCFGGFDNVAEFVNQEIDNFLVGYHRDRQQDQPRHIEVFGEKSTLRNMIHKACEQYYVPYSLGRGFCSTPVWRDMAQRFRQSGRKRMSLIIVSDFDPEGLELADDAIRTLGQLWDIPIDGHRIAVTREQIDDLNLATDFNTAKDTSSRYKSFVERTGDTKTWEVESLQPDYLVDQIQAAIEANMDLDTFNGVLEQEDAELDQLMTIREQIAGQLSLQ
jgi:hypothetical protein